MKDYIIHWLENHTYEYPDGTWSLCDNSGMPYGERFTSESALYETCWQEAEERCLDAMVAHAENFHA